MTLHFVPALEREDLLSPPVQSFLREHDSSDVFVAEIDVQCMGGEDLCARYSVPKDQGANCIVLEYIRGKEKNFAACLFPVSCSRVDLNGVIRRALGARRVSLAPLELVLEKTQMEYGSITPIGLPASWPLVLDAHFSSLDAIILGSGLQRSKLRIEPKLLFDLPNTIILDGLCRDKKQI